MTLAALSPAMPWLQHAWGAAAAVLGIVLIDIVLAGDNAVLIALAVRQLQPQTRWMGISVGVAIAVVLRVALTFVAMQILSVPWLKLIGGVLIFWIAIKLLRENTDGEPAAGKDARTLWQAIGLIVVADLTMSLDNVLAVAGAAQGRWDLLVFGLIISIPVVMFCSGLLARLMDQFPALVYVGAAVLGCVAGGMAVTDHGIEQEWHATPWAVRAIEALGAGLVLLTPILRRSDDHDESRS